MCAVNLFLEGLKISNLAYVPSYQKYRDFIIFPL